MLVYEEGAVLPRDKLPARTHANWLPLQHQEAGDCEGRLLVAVTLVELPPVDASGAGRSGRALSAIRHRASGVVERDAASKGGLPSVAVDIVPELVPCDLAITCLVWYIWARGVS